MSKFRLYQFFRDAGMLGGGSVIFAICLFLIGIWEHYKQRSVPASWLVGAGVACFCLGAYRAWLQEVHLKEEALRRNEVPEFVINIAGWTVDFDVALNKSRFFMAVSALNTGHSSCLIGWHVAFFFGADMEVGEIPNLPSPMSQRVRDYVFTYTQEELINTKTRQNQVTKGSLVDGRLFFTLDHDRRAQQNSGIVKVVVSCRDFTGRTYKSEYVPSRFLSLPYKVSWARRLR